MDRLRTPPCENFVPPMSIESALTRVLRGGCSTSSATRCRSGLLHRNGCDQISEPRCFHRITGCRHAHAAPAENESPAPQISTASPCGQAHVVGTVRPRHRTPCSPSVTTSSLNRTLSQTAQIVRLKSAQASLLRFHRIWLRDYVAEMLDAHARIHPNDFVRVCRRQLNQQFPNCRRYDAAAFRLRLIADENHIESSNQFRKLEETSCSTSTGRR